MAPVRKCSLGLFLVCCFILSGRNQTFAAFDAVCQAGVKYGPKCNKLCSTRHCESSTSSCDTRTGACEGGLCKPGWMGVDCTQACVHGHYGAGCLWKCNNRQCAGDKITCHHVTGICVDGCQPGWDGKDCVKSCTLGMTYGRNCEKSCHVRNCDPRFTTPCPRDTGACSFGCDKGWDGDDCTQKCAGMYGPDCSLNCTLRHCKNDNSSCDFLTGECVGGCKPGWTNITCTQQSPHAGTYSSTVVALSAVIGVLIVVVVILLIITVRCGLTNRKLRGLNGHSVSYSNKAYKRENQTSTTTTLSAVYEIVDRDANGESMPASGDVFTPTPSGRVSETQPDYVNHEHVNDYDRLDVDAVEEGSAYTKIET